MNRMPTLLCFLWLGCAASSNGDRASAPGPDEQASSESSRGAKNVASTPAMYDARTTSITARVGEVFVIELEANRTTPFEWVLAIEPPEAVTLVKQSYEPKPRPDCPDCVGVGGIERFELRGAAVGASTLRFRYRSIVDAQKPPARQHDVAVSVSGT